MEGICPNCGKPTNTIKLGSEPARVVCGRFGCDYSGEVVA